MRKKQQTQQIEWTPQSQTTEQSDRGYVYNDYVGKENNIQSKNRGNVKIPTQRNNNQING